MIISIYGCEKEIAEPYRNAGVPREANVADRAAACGRGGVVSRQPAGESRCSDPVVVEEEEKKRRKETEDAAGSFCSISRRICRVVDYLPRCRLFPSVLSRSMTSSKQPPGHGTMACFWTVRRWAKGGTPSSATLSRTGDPALPLFYLRAQKGSFVEFELLGKTIKLWT